MNKFNYYSEEDVLQLKSDQEKQIRLIKKAAEIQMRNIKILAKENAKKMIEETVARINKQFQSEIIDLLHDYQVLKE